MEIPQWILSILITLIISVIIALIKYAWHSQGKRLDKVEKWIDMVHQDGGPLTIKGHQRMCKEIMIKEESDMNEALQQFKEWLGLKLDVVNTQMVNLKREVELNYKSIDDKIENKILKELHKLNGKSN